jgi:glycosyltransferase involved in cell wall biosynthesis
MRYAWDQFDAYLGPQRVGWVASQLARPVMAAMARWDQRTAGRVDRYVANSQYVARRIRRYYNREAVVVYPPVDTAFYHPDGTVPEAWVLIVTALVPYKRVELAIEACRRANVPLKIVGAGPERGRLERMAGPQVEFLGVQRGDRLRTLYRAAAAVVQPGEEDFGIVPVEAQACGRPVVALGRGGALETVQDGVTGVLVAEPTVEAFADGLKRAQALSFDPATIRAHALRFEPSRFAREIRTQVADVFDHAQTV